jgi:hypothetical protein
MNFIRYGISMIRVLGAIVFVFVLAVLVTFAKSKMGLQPMITHPQDLPWKMLPNGVQIYDIKGSMHAQGPFMTLVKAPPGYVKKPHYHPTDAYVVLISGEHHVGYGNVMNKNKAVTMTPGTVNVNPKGVVHYEWTDKGSLLVISSTGPWKTTYVNSMGQPM